MGNVVFGYISEIKHSIPHQRKQNRFAPMQMALVYYILLLWSIEGKRKFTSENLT
jgi:hypothetical protein